MNSIVLFRCCDTHTPLARLWRLRRWADWAITAWVASAVLMVETIASLVLVGPSTVEAVLFLICTAVCVLTSVPAIILLPIVGEIERELSARGALPANYRAVENRLDRYGRRLLLFFILTVVVIAVVR